jgi:hypothetical protein
MPSWSNLSNFTFRLQNTVSYQDKQRPLAELVS